MTNVSLSGQSFIRVVSHEKLIRYVNKNVGFTTIIVMVT